MKHVFTLKATRIALVVAVAALLAPAAYAKGGAVIHTYASPPLDAGSAVPNPDYFPEVARGGPARPDDRANRAAVHGTRSGSALVQSAGDGFDWGDAGIGAAGAVALALAGVGSAITLRRNRHREASA